MLRWCVFVLCVLLMTTVFAAKKREDDVMGLYLGAFEDGAWQARAIEAKVMARGETRWQAALYVTAGDSDPVRVTVTGERPRDAEAAAFAGDVDLGAALGGTYAVRGKIEDRTFTGHFRQGGGQIAFTLDYTEVTPPSLGAPCPDDGMVLFDGTNLDQWQREPEKWCLTEDSAMQVCGSGLRTIEEFGSAKMHIEFRTPFMPDAIGQARGNSGVYVAGIYELQVLDSFGLPPAWNHCGGIYKISPPSVNATLPPAQWQTYDIDFQAAQFNAQGEKTANARITVIHNGTVIHDDLTLDDRTPGGMGGGERPQGPIYLQDHGNDVRFRNIWIVPQEG
ncbi:MAG: DUF1080 domain-containing protein [Candidatus Hydrogenedentota bacterium]